MVPLPPYWLIYSSPPFLHLNVLLSYWWRSIEIKMEMIIKRFFSVVYYIYTNILFVFCQVKERQPYCSLISTYYIISISVMVFSATFNNI